MPSQVFAARRWCWYLSPRATCFFFLFTLIATDGREAEERSRFLYAGDPSASGVVLDYQLHLDPNADFSGDGREKENDEQKHAKPYFLLNDYGRARVVEFYSPWCGHCQAFKPKYVALATEVRRRARDEVEFHAVSCSAHDWVCKDNKVRAFPTIKMYEAGSVTGQILNRFTADEIADAVGVSLNEDVNYAQNVGVGDSRAETQSASIGEDGTLLGGKIRPVDILGASRVRTKEAVYNDAALSFTYALKTSVFLENSSGPLDSTQKAAFTEWIDLLYWTLPPTWKLHTLINDIRNNIHVVSNSRESLYQMVQSHQEVVNENSAGWSSQCNRGRDKPSAGFHCGFWSLMHIVSIGVIERHNAVLGSLERVSTKHVAETLRNYIDAFFGECEACRSNFLDMYDWCGHNHCKRFRQQKKASSKSWNEFALWLWEVHNDVNIRVAVDSDEDAVLWPSKKACQQCRREGGDWDYDSVLSHLKTVYWPGGIQNFRFVVLDKKDGKNHQDNQSVARLLPRVALLALALMLLIWTMKREFGHMALKKSGWHKKNEHEHFV